MDLPKQKRKLQGLQKNFNQGKIEYFDINIENENTVVSNERKIVSKGKIEKINNEYMVNAMNFADIFNIKIFRENNNKVKLVNE